MTRIRNVKCACCGYRTTYKHWIGRRHSGCPRCLNMMFVPDDDGRRVKK